MFMRFLHPLLCPSTGTEGPGTAAAAPTGPVLPAAAIPSTSTPVPNTSQPTIPEGQRGQQAGDAPAATGEPSSGEPGGDKKAVNYLAPDFDPATIGDPAARQLVETLRAQHAESLSSVPDKETLAQIGMKAQAWERLTASEEWERFKTSLQTGTTVDAAAAQAGDPKLNEVLSSLDDEQKQAVQFLIDQYAGEKVTPMLQELISDKAKMELDRLEQRFGEDWTRLKGKTVEAMKLHGVDAETAYRIVWSTDRMQNDAAAAGQTVREKIAASTVGDGSPATAPTVKPSGPLSVAQSFETASQAFDRLHGGQA